MFVTYFCSAIPEDENTPHFRESGTEAPEVFIRSFGDWVVLRAFK